jgi:hypothetical protein
VDLSRKWLRREVEKRPVSRVRIEIPLKYQRLIEAALAIGCVASTETHQNAFNSGY